MVDDMQAVAIRTTKNFSIIFRQLVGRVMRDVRLEEGYLCVGQVDLTVGRFDEC